MVQNMPDTLEIIVLPVLQTIQHIYIYIYMCFFCFVLSLLPNIKHACLSSFQKMEQAPITRYFPDCFMFVQNM